MPVTTPADGQLPCSSYIPSAENKPISKKYESLSINASILSLAVNLDFALCFSIALSPPPRYVFSDLSVNSCNKVLYES